MYDPSDEKDTKLSELRQDFQAAINRQEDAQNEAHRASRFYHNTNNEGQWESEDLEYLRSQGRPAFTFNMVRGKVDTFVGMMTDSMKHAEAAPIGKEDTFTAEVLNAMTTRVYDLAHIDRFEHRALRNGSIMGEWSVRLISEADEERPGFRKIVAQSIPRYEVHWDPDSMEVDRSDARFVFWDKWLSRSEFNRLYPDADYDELIRKANPEGDRSGEARDFSEGIDISLPTDQDMYSSGAWNRYYYDDKHDKIRVIHAEYKILEHVYWLRHPETGVTQSVSKRVYDRLEQYQESGVLQGLEKLNPGYRTSYTTIQFVGPEILYEGPTGQSYDGFSIRPFVYAIDTETGASYGMVRNLIDPQMEVNKAHSQSLENLVGQSKPGVIAEETSIPDLAAFEEQMRITGGVAIAADGALAENRLRERSPAQYSPAIEQRLEGAVGMLDKISSIHTDLAAPAAQQEAASTVQLRYRKSLLAQADARSNFESFQADLARMVLAIVVKEMPDEQWAEYLGAADRFVVQGGTVIELDPQSKQPKQGANLRDIRALRFDIRMEMRADNPTLRLMEMEALSSLAQLDVPIDPVVLVELATGSRSVRERLKQFAEMQSAQQAQAAQQASQQQEQQLQAALMLEAKKAQEEVRHNQAQEELTRMRQVGDHQIRMADIWERADRDEKRALIELMRTIHQRQKVREDHVLDAHSLEQAASRPTQPQREPSMTPMEGRSAVPFGTTNPRGGGE